MTSDVSSSQPDRRKSALGGASIVLVLVGAVAILLALAVVSGGILVPTVVALVALAVPSLGALRPKRRPKGAAEADGAKPAATPAPSGAGAGVASAELDRPPGDLLDDAGDDAAPAAPAPGIEPFADDDLPGRTEPAVPFADDDARGGDPARALDGAAASHSGETGYLDGPERSLESVSDVGQKAILLVDDEDALRRFCARILERAGYEVLQARTGIDAVAMAESEGLSADLLLTDVVMPQMSGRELAERMTEIKPDLKVVFVSGYADDTIQRHGIERDGVAFLQKPFKSGELLDAVTAALAA
jgi:CheY-like chemotaxis protein